jgi:hypothetical protein
MEWLTARLPWEAAPLCVKSRAAFDSGEGHGIYGTSRGGDWKSRRIYNDQEEFRAEIGSMLDVADEWGRLWRRIAN